MALFNILLFWSFLNEKYSGFFCAAFHFLTDDSGSLTAGDGFQLGGALQTGITQLFRRGAELLAQPLPIARAQ